MPPTSPDDESGDFRRKGEADAYGALGLIISGVLVWGGVGYAVSEWLDNRVFVMLGLLLGMGAGLYLVWFRYGRTT
jgi:ATP synthase protein I